jgi:hypothetical protein
MIESLIVIQIVIKNFQIILGTTVYYLNTYGIFASKMTLPAFVT